MALNLAPLKVFFERGGVLKNTPSLQKPSIEPIKQLLLIPDFFHRSIVSFRHLADVHYLNSQGNPSFEHKEKVVGNVSHTASSHIASLVIKYGLAITQHLMVMDLMVSKEVSIANEKHRKGLAFPLTKTQVVSPGTLG